MCASWFGAGCIWAISTPISVLAVLPLPAPGSRRKLSELKFWKSEANVSLLSSSFNCFQKKKNNNKKGFFCFPLDLTHLWFHCKLWPVVSALYLRLPWLWIFPLWPGGICQCKDFEFWEGIKIQSDFVELSFFTAILVKNGNSCFL